MISVSKTVEFAIFANDIAYLGSVFLSMSMLLTIIKLCGFEVKKKLVIMLLVIGAVMFAVIATMPMEEKILKVLSFLKPGEMLAERERKVLELVLQNKKRKEIAEELCLSENTIKTYTGTLYGKVGVSSREELYALLIK